MADAKQKLIIDVKAKNTAALGGVAAGLNSVKVSALGAGAAMKLLGPLLAILLTGKLIKDIVTTNSRFEDLRTTLSSVTGSVKEGAKAFEFISEFSTKTQFGIEDLTKAYVKLSAAGLEPTEELLNTFTDTAAITTDQVGSLEAVTDMFARTVSGGFNLEIVNRLADRGVPILDIFEKKLGLTRNEITKFGMSAEGSRILTEAFQEGIKERFGGATQKLLENTSTKFSNLGIALKNAADDIGESLKPAIGDTTVALTAFIEENEEAIIAVAKFVGTALSKLLWIFGQIFGAVFKVIGAIAKLGNALTDLLGITQKSNKAEKERVKNLKLFHQGYKVLPPAIDKAAKAQEEMNKKFMEAFNLNQIEESHNAMHDMMNTVASDAEEARASWKDFAGGFKDSLLTQSKAIDLLHTAGADMFSGLTDSITDFVMTGKINFKDFANDVIRSLVRIASQALITWAFTTAVNAMAGGGTGWISTIGTIFGGKKQHGGAVSKNKSYMVGEEGAEMFIPNTAGNIVPNNQMGAAVGGEVTVNFNISTVDADSFDDLLLSRKGLIIGTIQQAFRQQGRRFA